MPTKASIDQSSVGSITAVLNSTGASVQAVGIDPTTHHLMVTDDTTGSDSGPSYAFHDVNDRPTMMAVASRTVTSRGISYVQGVTPVPLYADSTGRLLTDSL